MKINVLHPTMLVADNPDNPDEAFGDVSLIPWNGGVFLFKLFVGEKYRGKGHARRLMEAAIEYAKENSLYLVPGPFGKGEMSKVDLIHWYQRLGFEVVDRKEHGYGGKSTLMLRKGRKNVRGNASKQVHTRSSDRSKTEGKRKGEN